MSLSQRKLHPALLAHQYTQLVLKLLDTSLQVLVFGTELLVSVLELTKLVA